VSKWSSYEKDKAIADAWRAYLKTEEVAVEVKSFKDVVGGLKGSAESPTPEEDEELDCPDEEEDCDEPEEDSSLRPPLSHYAPGEPPEAPPHLKKRKR
tara:strand:+ start:670 stop:963 length:294 start_codon:yes stop_codon:yes gene_type:complete